jgi:two-component system, OmpR family, alkaline phosphatase synthesis response regulator PhoP
MEPHKQLILLVEDDATISELLAYNLRRAGYEVIQEHNGRSGLETALSHPVELVLMDLMLPGLDGMTASREIARRKPGLPLIMLTARSERETMLQGFESGADDYVTKPFDLELLLARIEARLRRSGVAASDSAADSMVATGDLILDRDSYSASTSLGTVPLSRKEYELLALLLSRPGRLFGREEIVHQIWHQRYMPASRTLDVHVRRLRQKLQEIGAKVTIQTVRGVGYRVGPS